MARTTKTVELKSNPLTSMDLQETQEMLFLKRKALLENSIQRMQKTEHSRTNHSDLADKASAEEEFRMTLRTQTLEQNLIRDIDNALQNIKNGEFGYCALCGNEIGKKRLQAHPMATHCIECKTTSEMKKGYRTSGELL